MSRKCWWGWIKTKGLPIRCTENRRDCKRVVQKFVNLFVHWKNKVGDGKNKVNVKGWNETEWNWKRQESEYSLCWNGQWVICYGSWDPPGFQQDLHKDQVWGIGYKSVWLTERIKLSCGLREGGLVKNTCGMGLKSRIWENRLENCWFKCREHWGH